MAEPEDMILPMFREIRAEITSLNTRVDQLRTRMDERFDEVTRVQKTFKQALSADSLMTRLLTGEFEGRIENVEKFSQRIDTLEQQVRTFEGRS